MNLPIELEYNVEAYWDGRTGGRAEIEGGDVAFDRPRVFLGEGSSPCPDQLFLSSLTGCLINTFLYFVDRLDVKFIDIRCRASMQIDLNQHKGYHVNQINAMIMVWTNKDYSNLIFRCAELARDHCHLTSLLEKCTSIQVGIEIFEK